MNWQNYETKFIKLCEAQGVDNEYITPLLEYAKYLYEKNLPIIFDINHFSQLVGYDKELLYAISNEQGKFYRKFYIAKRNGKNREINEPYTTLKEIQNWILKNILERVPPSKFAKAYIKNKNINDNAKFHKNQNIVIKIDIENFFGSISIEKIYFLFYELGYTKSLSGLLANICCLDENLPQGAPTSPYLSNLIMRIVDKEIGDFVIKKGYRYTRYSDDLTISGNIDKIEIPRIIYKIIRILKLENLQINKDKLQVLRNSNRQVVTGIVVNNTTLRICREKKKRIRQEIYYIKKFGLEDHLKRINENRKNYIYHLIGKINWILSVEKDNKEIGEYKKYIYDNLINLE